MKETNLNPRLLIGIVIISLLITLACGGSDPAAIIPTSIPEAETAITSFAQEQLGISVNLLYAGNASEGIKTFLKALPSEVQALMESTPELANQSHWGLLNNGVAIVGIGTCGEDAGICSVDEGNNLQAQLTAASLGVYALQHSGAMPSDAAAAEALLKEAFPALALHTFTQADDNELQGYHFYSVDVNFALNQPLATGSAKTITMGISEFQGQVVIYAAVGVGDFVPVVQWGK